MSSSQVIQLFKDPGNDSTYTVPKGGMMSEYKFPIGKASKFEQISDEDRALKIAYETGFDKKCDALLWGNESREELGSLLRDLVLHFLPTTSYQITLLVSIADCEWKLRRLRKLQQAVYNGQQAVPTEHGVSAKTRRALDYEDLISEQERALSVAIRLYKQAKM